MSWLTDLLARGPTGHVAIVTDDATVTYAELAQRVARAAGWLRSRGVRPGDVVALQTPRCLGFLEVHLAALGAGVTTLPLNTAYTVAELRYTLADSNARLAVVLAEHAPELAELHTDIVAADDAWRSELDAASADDLPATLPDETIAVLLYTSGTTGHPKGAMLSHANVRATVDALVQAWRWRQDDVLLHVLPLFHVHGLFVAQHAALRAGATTLWETRFDAAGALRRIARDRATVFMGVPTHYRRIIALDDPPPNLSSMRLFTSGSAPLPAADHREFEARTGHRIVERYGMTEVGIVLSNPIEGERRAGTVGSPLPGAAVRVVDPATGQPREPGAVGEIQISGPSVFRGYLGRPEQTAGALVDGWMRSGDLGFVDADGYFHIVGRSKDMILSGGLNVYPAEVEGVLVDHPDVDEAAVVGVDDPEFGEHVVATVVMRDGADTPAADLLDWCRAHLAAYKCPKRVRTTQSLPRNTMGKVQKAVLRAEWAATRCRRSRAADLDTVVAWNVAMARETEGIALDVPTVRRGVARVLNGEVDAWYVIAEVGARIVGQCMVTVEWSDWRDRPVWWFQSVYVDPHWRGRGVFRTMYDHVLTEAHTAGAGGVRLYVDRRNTQAQGVYRSLGMNGDHYAVFEAMFDEPRTAEPPGVG